MSKATKTETRATEVAPAKPNVVLITTDKLVELLMEQKGATMVTFAHRADMSKTGKMRKGNNPFFGDCFKTQIVNGVINFHYAAGVLRRLEKEGKSADDFKQGKSWHEPVLRADGSLTPFARKKTDPRIIYIRFLYRSTVESRYHTKAKEIIDTDDIKPFLPKKTTYANQGLEKPLIFNTWGIDSIIAITMRGQRYVVANK